jgi:hypothetical protein
LLLAGPAPELPPSLSQTLFCLAAHIVGVACTAGTFWLRNWISCSRQTIAVIESATRWPRINLTWYISRNCDTTAENAGRISHLISVEQRYRLSTATQRHNSSHKCEFYMRIGKQRIPKLHTTKQVTSHEPQLHHSLIQTPCVSAHPALELDTGLGSPQDHQTPTSRSTIEGALIHNSGVYIHTGPIIRQDSNTPRCTLHSVPSRSALRSSSPAPQQPSPSPASPPASTSSKMPGVKQRTHRPLRAAWPAISNHRTAAAQHAYKGSWTSAH